MFDHLIGETRLEQFYSHLEDQGIREIGQFAKGTTGLVFRGKLDEKTVIIKLQRPDSPRSNLHREAGILRALEPFGVTPPFISFGTFEGLPYLIREFAEGEPVLYARIEKRHLFQIAEKTALLDRIGLDHGQIQGGKHLLLGGDVWIIDFEKAGWRKPNNLTSAMSMLFLARNVISKRVCEEFGLDGRFKEELKKALGEYKRKGCLSCVLGLLSVL